VANRAFDVALQNGRKPELTVLAKEPFNMRVAERIAQATGNGGISGEPRGIVWR